MDPNTIEPLDPARVYEYQFELAMGYPQLKSAKLAGMAASVFAQTAASPGVTADVLRSIWSRFFTFAGQETARDLDKIHARNASDCIIAAAKALKHSGIKTMGVIDPSPKFIRDIMRMEGLEPKRLAENNLYYSDDIALENIDALFLTVPGNPTGAYPDEAHFRKLMQAAKDKNIPVIVDFCFRLFAPIESWDQYKIMQDIGVEYIAIEDTGKTFDAGGQKVATMITNNEQRAEDLQETIDMRGPIATATAKMVGTVMSDALQGCALPFDLPVRQVVRENRRILEGFYLLDSWQPESDVPFAQLRQRGKISDSGFRNCLENFGIAAAPLAEFHEDFSYDPRYDSRGVRISLARDPEHFRQFVARLFQSVKISWDKPADEAGARLYEVGVRLWQSKPNL